MKYFKEVYGLMAPHPGREWKFGEIFRYVCITRRIERSNAAKVGVQRVLAALVETKSVRVIPGKRRNRYAWVEQSGQMSGAALVADIRALVEPHGGVELEIPPRSPMREPPEMGADRQ